MESHASGRRSGDQFCIYVADRLLLPRLAAGEIEAIAANTLSVDGLVRKLVREELSYRFVVVPDGAAARLVEREVRSGRLAIGKPMFNPIS